MAKTTGVLLVGSLKSAGITIYLKKGKTVVRSAHTEARRSNTRRQFVQRQRMRHTTSLWQALKPAGPVLGGGPSAYARFATLANRLPAVYVPCEGPLRGASLLLPGMPVSDGPLPPIGQRLGEVEGRAALLTDLEAGSLQHNESLRLYTAEQRIEGRTPRVRFMKVREVAPEELVEAGDGLALVDDVFADTMKGWALVRASRALSTGEWRSSSQGLVTRCTYYLPFTTEEALQEAAKSYGGLT